MSINYLERTRDKRLKQMSERYHNNKEKILAERKDYNESNKEKRAVYNKGLALSEGVGVYIVMFGDDMYVGKGQIYIRRRNHLNGNSSIGKKLNQKATSFKVIRLTESTQEARVLERKVIQWYGLDNLLNTRP